MTTTTINEMTPEFLSRYDNIIFDMDGVLIHGTEFMPGIITTLNKLKHHHNKRIFFCTNNSTQHRSHFYPWFTNAGLTDVDGHLYTAASTAASSVFNDVFNNIIPQTPTDPNYNTKVLVIGQPGLLQEFDDIGLTRHVLTLDDLRHPDQIKDVHQIKKFELDPNITAVCAGLQVDFSWRDCAIAVMIIRENNAEFYCTDRDATFPASHTRQLPGCGAIINMIEAGCGKRGQAMGKPTKYMADAIKRDHHLDFSRTLMVGDRLDSDIAFGNNFGMGSLLVFSGVTKKGDYLSDKIVNKVGGEVQYPQPIIPTSPQQEPTTPTTPTSPLPEINIHAANTPVPTYCAENITWMVELGGFVEEEKPKA